MINRLIDDENFIHHLKASETKDFGLWLEHFQQHRFYRQNQINSMSDKDGDPSGIFFLYLQICTYCFTLPIEKIITLKNVRAWVSMVFT